MTSRHLTQLMSKKSPSTFEVTLLTWCVIFYWGLLFGLWVNAWDTTLITSFIILDLKVRPVWHRSSCLLSLQVWGPLNYKCACDQKMTSGKRSKYIRNAWGRFSLLSPWILPCVIFLNSDEMSKPNAATERSLDYVLLKIIVLLNEWTSIFRILD